MIGIIFQKKTYISIINWKKSIVLLNFQAHNNWINTLQVLPILKCGVVFDCIISGSADGNVCFFQVTSGKVLNINEDGNRVVMHGMKLFFYEMDNQKVYYIISGGSTEIPNQKISHNFKIWF